MPTFTLKVIDGKLHGYTAQPNRYATDSQTIIKKLYHFTLETRVVYNKKILRESTKLHVLVQTCPNLFIVNNFIIGLRYINLYQ